MRTLITIISILWAFASFGQTTSVEKRVYPIDISDNAKKLFQLQMDTFRLLQKEKLPYDSFNTEYFYNNASIFYFKGSLNYGCRFHFGRTGGVGCGYHEGDEPHKMIVVNNGTTKLIPELYDFEDTSVWVSSTNWKQDKINLHFKKSFPPLTKLIFFPGDQSSEANWQKYSRPKTIKLLVNNKYWRTLELDKIISKQEFEFIPIESEHKDVIITLVILDTYKGQDDRVAISEINFDGIIH